MLLWTNWPRGQWENIPSQRFAVAGNIILCGMLGSYKTDAQLALTGQAARGQTMFGGLRKKNSARY
jgi:hypothetical protein